MTKPETRIEDLPDVFVACRAEGHWWQASWTFIEKAGRTEVYSAERVCKRERDAGVTKPTKKDDQTYAKGKNAGKPFSHPDYDYAPGYVVKNPNGKRGGSLKREAKVEHLSRIAVPRPAEES